MDEDPTSPGGDAAGAPGGAGSEAAAGSEPVADEAAGSDPVGGEAADGGPATVEAAEDDPVSDDAAAGSAPARTRGERAVAAMKSIRPPRSRKGRALASASLVALVLLGATGFFWLRWGDVPEGVAYRVADEEVTVQQLDLEVETLRALYGLQPPAGGPELDEFRRDMAQASAVGLMLENEAAARGITISDKVAGDLLTRYVNEFFGDGSTARDNFIQALGNVGTSERAVLGELKRQLAVRQLFDEITNGVSVGDQELRDAFEQRKEELVTPERRELRNIVVSTREDADRVMADLGSGLPFAQLATERSLDTSTKNQGGSLGAITADQLEPAYADAAFGAPPAGVFGPVETRFGWNVGTVERVLPPTPAVFADVSEQLRQAVGLEKASGVWSNWLGQRIQDADVRYADAYRPDNPDALPSESLQPATAPGRQQPGPQAPPN